MQEPQHEQQRNRPPLTTRSSSKKKREMIKGVRFPSRRQIMEQARQISRRSTYALSEMIAMWGDDEEHDKQRNELSEEVGKYEMGLHDSDNINFTTMGVEHLIDESRYNEKVQLREDAYQAVLWEQHYQREEEDQILAEKGIVVGENTSPEDAAQVLSDEHFERNGAALSEVYQTVSKRASNQAVEEAKRLSAELEELNKEDEKQYETPLSKRASLLFANANNSTRNLFQRCRQLSGRFVTPIKEASFRIKK